MTKVTGFAMGVEVNLVRQHRLRIELQRAQVAQKYFFIDIVGNCNLKCPSCAMGQEHPEKPKGRMALDMFVRILDKIEREAAGQSIFIDLFSWAEPLLHPDVAAYVKEVKRRGMGCGISSNLNISSNLRDVVKAGPDYIRVSLSGYNNDVYQRTHAGGDVNVVKSNLYLLRYLIDQYQSATIVQIGFHIYRSNFPNDFVQMLRLCDELEFIFEPTIATLTQVERVVEMMDGKETRFAGDLVANLVATPTKWKEIYDAEGLDFPDCQFRTGRTALNFDGSVSLCCAVFDNDFIIANDFEKVSQEQIEVQKNSHPFCATCMEHKMHMMYTGCIPEAMHQEAAEVLGPYYKEWRDASRFLGDRDVIVINNQFITVQEAYDRGVKLLQLGEKGYGDAEKVFSTLMDMAPHFGEGFFQGARVALAEGRLSDALARVRKAVALAPGHEGYRAELSLIDSMFEDGHAP